MLHNAPSSDLSSIFLFWKKSIKINHVSWIDTELIWNLIFPKLNSSPVKNDFLSGKLTSVKVKKVNWRKCT